MAQPGDSLGSIARSQLGDANRWRELCTLNELENCDLLRPGQTIRLPQTAAAAAPEAPVEAEPETAPPAPETAEAIAPAPDLPVPDAPEAEPADALPAAEAPASETPATASPAAAARGPNLLPNAALSGAVAGKLGESGALPTGWHLASSRDSDLEVEVLDSAPGSVTLSLRQTRSEGWGQLDLSPRGDDRLPATAAQVFDGAIKIELVSGTLDDAARLQLGLMHYQPDGERIRPDLYFATALAPAEAAEGFTGSVSTTEAETTSVGMFLRILFDGPLDVVLKVSEVSLTSDATN
ncbi:LysM peptidoglycan-binding domain-containing protein [Rhodobacter sp. ETT8]|uniref:LysM peptidoglycan-binding domain-containing protein n=1 Tax=Pseudotabrizicola algicola TaxID=2709381 RepID=A0A6B3RIL1_9RHOB|nr:LysM peptidoglycan-binding domain-containing protein [Pseudotabrizicola algicola]